MERQIVPLRDRKIRPQFLSIPALDEIQVKWNRPGEVLYIFTVAGQVPLEFRERQIVSFQSQEREAPIRRWEHRNQAVGVIFGDRNNPYMLHVYAMLLMQR
jgi:hypothetical protein